MSVFYTQRIITTYWVPDELDYDYYVQFGHEDIEASTGYFFLCTLSIFLGAIIGESLAKKIPAPNDASLSKPESLITYFGVTVSFEHLSRLVLLLSVPLFLANFGILATGFGLTGAVQESLQSVLGWFLGIPSALSPFIIVSLIYFRGNDKILVPAKWVFALSLIHALWLSSKGVLLSLALSWYLIASLTGRRSPKGFLWVAALVITFSIFIFFPLMTMLRSSLVSEFLDFDFDYFPNLIDALFSFLKRVGGFDWLNLWMSAPSNMIPPNANPISEAIGHLNRLIPGEIIAQPQSVDLAKLQVVLGRGAGDLAELGGHGENMGGLATAYIFLGPVGGLIYFVVLTAALIVVERSSMHVMHKYIMIFFYVIVFIIGGGSVLMHGSLFWFLMCTTFLASIIRFNVLVAKR